MNFPSFLHALLIALFFGSLCLAKDKTSDQEGGDLLAKAASLQNIHEQGGQPFRLSLRIHAEHVVSKPMDGAYAEVWMAPNKWRREIAFPGFSQLEIGDVDSKWLTRNLDFKPRIVHMAEEAVELFILPGGQQEGVVKSVRSKRLKGTELRCVELVDKDGKQTRELCFEGTGALFSESVGNQRFEYGQFGKFGGKIFPKSIHVYESGERVLDISADNLSSPSDSRDELFQHGPGAHQMAACERWPKLVKKVAPQYPPAARAAHQQGDVILYTLLSDKGTVETTTILQSAGDSLDRSAAEAVKQWIYAPPACGATPFQMEIEVRVNYELRVE
ncbi:MAG TPA: energy transducer TonB [Candidatus Sulfotelmatobacter sp.]|nr:energy transducer TonB [Candidatus Sulfotelmatobacter sp.]